MSMRRKAIVAGAVAALMGMVPLPGGAAVPSVGAISAVAVAPDGSVAFAADPASWETGTPAVYRVKKGRVAAVLGGARCDAAQWAIREAESAGQCLGNPAALSFDRSGTLFVGDHDPARVLRVGQDGTAGDIDGRPVAYPTTSFPRAPCWGWPAAPCVTPHAITVASGGTPLAVDRFASTLVALKSDGRRVVVAGNGTCGSIPGRGADATSIPLCPFDVAIAPDGAAWVLEWQHKNGAASRITRIARDGTFRVMARLCTTTMPCARAISIDRAGRVYLLTGQPYGTQSSSIGVLTSQGRFRALFRAANATAFAAGPSGEIVYAMHGHVYRRTAAGRTARIF